MCRRTRSCVGTARDSASSGVGSRRRRADHACPNNLQALIREMAAENTTWGQERIADELQLKLGIRVSPRTVAKYLRRGGPVRTPDPKQRWLTFVHNLSDGGNCDHRC